jgi:ferrous iron transport protein A
LLRAFFVSMGKKWRRNGKIGVVAALHIGKIRGSQMNSIPASEMECNDEARCGVCPLNAVKAGVQVRIRRLCAAPEMQDRLREIGLCEDQVIRLLTSQTNFICQVCNARLAISEQVARLILVEPVLRSAPFKK